MAANVTHDLTEISLCELDDWDGGLGALDPDSFVQGANCLTITYTGAGLRAKTMKTISCVLTNKNIYGWLTFARLAMLMPTASGGIRFRIEDGTYFAEWYVGGSDSATSGWMCYTCNCGVHPDRHGTIEDTDDANEPNYGAITKVGWRVNLAIKGIVKWDAFRYGTTISINEGTEGVPATFEDIWTAENLTANKYGILYKFEGAYFVQGKINIGSTTSDTLTYFKDLNQVIMFRDNKVPVGFYEIKLQGKSGVSNKIFLGSDPGIGGCTIKAPSALKWKLTATDTNITEFGFYGCSLINASTIEGQAYSSVKKFKGSSFTGCGEVIVNTCIVTNCNFISSIGSAVLISSINHNTTSCNFINCAEGVKLDTYNASAYPFNALVFTNTTYHVNNTSGSTLTVGNSNGSNASTYTGTLVNFTGSVVLTMTVKNEAGGVIVDAWAYIDPTDESPFIMNKLTNASGVASETYTGSPVNNTRWRVRKYGYRAYKQLIDIGGSNINVPVTLVLDPQQF